MNELSLRFFLAIKRIGTAVYFNSKGCLCHMNQRMSLSVNLNLTRISASERWI